MVAFMCTLVSIDATTATMGVLPPVETTPILLLRFNSKADEDLTRFVKERLAEGGIRVVTEERDHNGVLAFGLSSTQEGLEQEAELIKLVKPTTSSLIVYARGGRLSHRNSSIMEHFTVALRENFLSYPDTFPRDVDPITEYDSLGLFTSSDRALLVWKILDAINILDEGRNSSNLSKKLDSLGVPYLHHRHYSRSFSFIGKDVDEQTKASQTLRHVLEDSGIVDVVSPCHLKHIRDKILHETFSFRTGAPVHAIRSYYGEEIAFYFAWMSHFSKWMIVPGLMGIAIYIARSLRGDTVDTCELTPAYGLAVFMWAILFLRFWDRQEARLAYDWGTFSSTGYERKYFGSRPEFEGELRPSPVTGQMEKYYSPKKRLLKCFVSALVTCILLMGAFFVMILSLNLQGYVHPKDDRLRWGDGDEQHPFYYARFAAYSDEGNIFDSASAWKSLLPVVIHVMVVMTMNNCYRLVAERLTDWENHETLLSHENSLIIKRFLFEAFDAYVILFYLAFFERNIEKVRGELISVFNVDTFRRLLVECLIPMALKRLGGEGKKTDGARGKKFDGDKEDKNYLPLLKESKRDKYEQFDDYLEMLIELGYVTLFASAYPLASFISIFANFIEYRSDAWKLSKICLRPRSIRTDSIGTWKLLIKIIVWASALTNCLIFCFTSRQMQQWMPENFVVDSSGDHRFVEGKGWIAVLTMFGIERVLLLIGISILMLVPSVPEDVTIREERRQFIREQASQKIRASSFRRSKSE